MTSARPDRPTVYLAGPTVFEPDPGAIFQRMKTICDRHGLRGVSPLDNQIGLEGVAPDRALMARIVRADMELMDRLDSGVFCLDGFRRSPEMDPGTAFELGYMRALNKPVAGWTRDPRDYPAKVAAYFHSVFALRLHQTAPLAQGATSGQMRDPDGLLVHSAGCLQNAMIDCGIESAGGGVFAHQDWELAFGQAIAHLAQRLVLQLHG